jgi:hypothetical protein
VDRALAGVGAAGSSFTAAVRVLARPDDTWEATLTLQIGGVRTERHLQAESCSAIASAAALIVVMAIDDAPEPEASQPALTPAPAAELVLPPPATPEPRVSWLLLKVGGVLDWAAMPALPAVGLEVAGGAIWGLGAWRLHGLLQVDLFPYLRPPSDPELGAVGGHLWQTGVSGRACLETEALAPFELGPCLGVEGVVVHASSDGGNDSQAGALARATRFWGSALGALAAAWRISSSTELSLHLDLVVPVQRPTFEVAYDPFIHYRVPAFAVRGGLGVAMRFD